MEFNQQNFDTLLQEKGEFTKKVGDYETQIKGFSSEREKFTSQSKTRDEEKNSYSSKIKELEEKSLGKLDDVEVKKLISEKDQRIGELTTSKTEIESLLGVYKEKVHGVYTKEISSFMDSLSEEQKKLLEEDLIDEDIEKKYDRFNSVKKYITLPQDRNLGRKQGSGGELSLQELQDKLDDPKTTKSEKEEIRGKIIVLSQKFR